MVTERHNIAGRLTMTWKAISKGSLGFCLVSTDVGSADKRCMQNVQIPVTAESRVPPAWIFAVNHNRRDRLTSRPDAILVNPKKTRKTNSQDQQNASLYKLYHQACACLMIKMALLVDGTILKNMAALSRLNCRALCPHSRTAQLGHNTSHLVTN